jgi:hypothetical protein
VITTNAEVSPPHKLPVVLKEITEKLLKDDWSRFATRDGSRKYYIVGNEDQEADLTGAADFSNWQFPVPTRTGPLSEWAVRSQLADNRKDYLKQARSNLERAGVSATDIDSTIERGELNWKFDQAVPGQERLRLMSDFAEALRLVHSDPRDLELDSDEATEAEIKREKLCLQEITAKYVKIVDRWEQLERLPFDDAQLLEASKTFLYGFYRASILLCASAIETQLKRLVPGVEWAAELIHQARARKLISRDVADHAFDLFEKRNRVAHDNSEPTSDDAKEVLVIARKLVAELRSI